MVTQSSTDTPTGVSGTVLQGQGVGTANAFSTATYPATASTVGQILKASGTNWVAANYSIVVTAFTSTSTYTPTSGMLYCIVEVVGGGGGSGGCATTGAGTIAASGGGGGGGYARKTVSAATIAAASPPITVTVGAAGLAGTAGNNAGGTGGTSSLGSIVSATGGVGGVGSAAAVNPTNAGGLGGIGSSGDINSNGNPGFSGVGCLNTNAFLLGGLGGSSYFGGAGQVANVGTAFGGGGGGVTLFINTTQTVGFAGAKGVVIITEYIIN